MDPEQQCRTCEVKGWGGEGSLISVWQSMTDYENGEAPDYIGCTDCNTMEEYDG